MMEQNDGMVVSANWMEVGTTLIGWVTKPDEQSVRKVSEFSPSCRRPSLTRATFVLFKQQLNRGEQLLTKVNTSLRAKFEFFYIFCHERKRN